VDETPQRSRWHDTLRAHYEQWRVLTEAEGAAIAAGEQGSVEQLQQAKRQLQAPITETTRRLREENERRGLAPTAVEWEFQPIIRKLLDLERANIEALAARKRNAARKREQLDQIAYKLQQLRRAYAHNRSPVWQAYS